MRLTNQTNYAVRMLMYCAAKGGADNGGATGSTAPGGTAPSGTAPGSTAPGGTATVGEIAAFYRLPQPFLFKIAKVLTEGGFLVSQRGRKGGIRLARPAGQIVLGHVVRETEASFELAECFRDDDVTCPLVMTCGLNQTLHAALDAFFAVLDRTTIADLAANRHNIGVLQQLHEARRAPLERATEDVALAG